MHINLAYRRFCRLGLRQRKKGYREAWPFVDENSMQLYRSSKLDCSGPESRCARRRLSAATLLSFSALSTASCSTERMSPASTCLIAVAWHKLSAAAWILQQKMGELISSPRYAGVMVGRKTCQ